MSNNRQEQLPPAALQTRWCTTYGSRWIRTICSYITASACGITIFSPHSLLLLESYFTELHNFNPSPHLLHASHNTKSTSSLSSPHPKLRKHVQQMFFHFFPAIIVWAAMHSFNRDKGLRSRPCLRDMSSDWATGLGLSMHARSRGCCWTSTLQRRLGK